MPKILIIEDDAAVRQELELLLVNSGYETACVEDFANIQDKAQKEKPDLILLDIGLPDVDGYTVCASLRRISDVPVIFITSRNNTMDEIKALSFGGDDYITKPYNIPVLLARISANLRRGSADNSEVMTFKDINFNLSKSIVEHNGKEIELSKNENKILYVLFKNEGKIMPRADIIEFLWDNQVYIDDNTLSVNVTRLRAKLNEIGLEELIQTKRGIGYIICV